MLLFGCLGNILIILFFTQRRRGRTAAKSGKQGVRRRHPYTLFFVHLACADLFACFFVPLYYIPQDFSNGQWVFGKALCEYTIFVPTGVAMYASCWILFGIIYERHRSLVHPLRVKINRTHVNVFCACAWLLSFVMHVPYLLATSLERDTETGVLKCVSSPSSLFKETWAASVVFYYILRLIFQSLLPVTLMAYYYRGIHNAMCDSSKGHNTSLGIETRVTERLRAQKQSVLRAIRTAFLVFAFTIVMNNMAHLTRAVMQDYYKAVWQNATALRAAVDFFIRFLGINNIINCIIYAGSMASFRKFVTSTVLRCFSYCCRCCCFIKSWKAKKDNRDLNGDIIIGAVLYSEDEVAMFVISTSVAVGQSKAFNVSIIRKITGKLEKDGTADNSKHDYLC